MTGYELSELTNQKYCSFSSHSTDAIEGLQKLLESAGSWRGEMPGYRKSGEQFPALSNIAVVRDAYARFSHYVAVCTDLTTVQTAQRQLYLLAHHDPMTGLPNRLMAMDRLQYAMDWAKRRNSKVAVLFIDLDHFKRVNDTLGHAIGDDLLRAASVRLLSCLREEDTVARLGGDEFMVILQQIKRIEDAAVIAEKIVNAFNVPFELQVTSMNVSTSIGISFFPDDGLNREDLIRAADTAMYAAKGQGRQRYTFYTAAMTEAAIRYMELSQDLRRGLAAGELRLVYQPQIDLSVSRVVAVEALIRWQHPIKGLLGAGEIIPIAEESGLIVEIGEWVIQQASKQARLWLNLKLPAIRIAVNVSIRQIYQDRLLNSVCSALKLNELSSSALEIEITESTLQSEEACLPTLEKLNEMGVALAIDDFGTGYSCLSSLKAFPIQRVKIDRAFISGIPKNEDDCAIAQAIIGMAHRLKLRALAEGVETVEQELFLRSNGCDEVQGFYYAKPLAPEEVAELLRRQDRSG